jgi:hypothetical protein
METSRRHRILIAAAVAAVVSGARIREIKPAAWTRRRPAGERCAPDFRRPIAPPELKPELEPEEEEVS